VRPRTFTDDELLEVARRWFLAEGPAVATSKIAADLGVSAAALFRRMGSKAELMRRALGVPECPDWVRQLEDGPDDRPVQTQLRQLAHIVDDFFETRLPALAVFRAAGIHPAELFADMPLPPPVRAAHALRQWLDALVDDGRVGPIDSQAIAIAFLGSLQSRHMLRHACGASYPDGGPAYATTVADVFTTALPLAPEERHPC
jgi:AcrR family transcriptional regulator